MSKTIYINKEEELVLESESEVKEYLLDNISYTNRGFQYWLDDRYCASELLEDIEDYSKDANDFIEEYIEECWEDLLEDFDLEEVELEPEVLLINEAYKNYLESDYIRPIVLLDLLCLMDIDLRSECKVYVFHTKSLFIEEYEKDQYLDNIDLNVFKIAKTDTINIYCYLED